MIKKSLPIASLLVLAAGLLVLAQPVLACTGLCQVTPQPGKPFCRTCVDAGYDTGVMCQQSGPCGCFYVQCASFSTVATGLGTMLVPNLDCQGEENAEATAELFTHPLALSAPN